MKLNPSLARRLAAGIGLAGAAALLPTVALAAPAAPAHRAGAAASVMPACKAVHTRVWFGLPADHAAGHTDYQIQISNVGRSECRFFGFPGISALNRRGQQVGLPAGHVGPRIGVSLFPGQTAHVVLTVVNAFNLCTHPVRATQIRVFPPGQFHSQEIPLATLACRGLSVMDVDSIHQNAGIPGFSGR